MLKKCIALLVILALCLTLAACADSSGSANPDYEYLLHLLDNGEYDMAIQVIEMLRKNAPSSTDDPSGQNSQTLPDEPSGQNSQTPSDEPSGQLATEFEFTAPGEYSTPVQTTLINGTDFRFGVDLFNYTDSTLTLKEIIIISYEDGGSSEYHFNQEQLDSTPVSVLEPNTGTLFDDYHPNPAPFSARDYIFIYQDDAGNEYRFTAVFDLSKAIPSDAPSFPAAGIDYSQDQGRDLFTLRYDADYQLEVAPGIYWVPARSLGESRYTNADIFQMVQNSPEDKQSAISTLYEALQLYQVGGFASADDNIRISENGINWEHHKPGYYAVLTNCGCCATDSNWLHYILDGDYDEVGYIAFSMRDGNGHVFNYILRDSWYYVIDLTHYRTDWIATAVEDGSPDSYRNSDPVLGNIHKTQSLETFAEYLLDNTGDPPGLIFAYTASDAPALDSLRAQDGSVEIVYARMNDLDLHIIFDDPGDQLTTRLEKAPANQPRWS